MRHFHRSMPIEPANRSAGESVDHGSFAATMRCANRLPRVMDPSRNTSMFPSPAWRRSPTLRLLPIMAAVFIGFLVIGIAIPVLPLHVHQGLGLGTFLVGLVAGSQFAAAILSRVWAGRHSDRKGAKHAVITGLMIGAAAGVLYLISLERFPKRLNPGFPCRRESDSSSLLGGGQHGWRSHIRRTCVDAWSKR